MHFSHTPNRLRSGRPNRDASFHQGVQAIAGAGWLAAFYPITSQIIRAGVNDRCLHRQAQHIRRQFIPDMGCGWVNKRIGHVFANPVAPRDRGDRPRHMAISTDRGTGVSGGVIAGDIETDQQFSRPGGDHLLQRCPADEILSI